MSVYDIAIERFPRLRQSRLATFDRCALSASFEEDYRADWTSHPAARGQIFHRFAAKALKEMSANDEGQIETDVAISILDECLRQHDIDLECPKCFKPIIERAAGRIRCAEGHDHRSDFVNIPMEEVKDLRWVVVKWATDNTFDIENLVDVEQRLGAPIRYQDPGGEYVERQLTGQLDALFVVGADDDHGIVLDWKDTWGLPGPTEVGFDGYFQQRFYAWLVFKRYPTIQKVTLKEFYVRFSEPREATVWRADMEDVEAELSALAERFDRAFTEQNFPPSPGHHCQLCPRPTACPIFPGVRGEGAITDRKVAARVARELTVAEQAVKQRKEQLKAYTSVHGPEEVSSHKGKKGWTHKVSKRVSRPSKKAMEEALAAQRAGVPLRLDELYKEAQTTRFGLHTIVEEDDTADDAALMAALEQSVAAREK